MSRPDRERRPKERRPKDPAERSLARHGFGRAFWVLLGLGLACVLAGVVIAAFGPSLFPAKPPNSQAAPPPLGKPAPPR